MTTFEDAKVGDRVWCILYGWGTIANISSNIIRPLEVAFEHNNLFYMRNGKCSEIDVNQSLFWDEVVITPPEKPLPKLEVDTKVLVWDNRRRQHIKRHFSHFDKDGTINVFANGTTSWNYNITVPYCYWELAKD